MTESLVQVAKTLWQNNNDITIAKTAEGYAVSGRKKHVDMFAAQFNDHHLAEVSAPEQDKGSSRGGEVHFTAQITSPTRETAAAFDAMISQHRSLAVVTGVVIS